MNALQAKWIEELRSGRLVQGVGGLRPSENTYCCLGVACQVYDPQRWSLDPEHRSFAFYDENSQWLPGELNDAFQIDGSLETTLIEMNDQEKRSFAEIADFLEQEFREQSHE